MFCEAEVWFVLWLAERDLWKCWENLGNQDPPILGSLNISRKAIYQSADLCKYLLTTSVGPVGYPKNSVVQISWKSLYEAMVLYRFHEEVLYEALVFD
jgi:hypothetical protein